MDVLDHPRVHLCVDSVCLKESYCKWPIKIADFMVLYVGFQSKYLLVAEKLILKDAPTLEIENFALSENVIPERYEVEQIQEELIDRPKGVYLSGEMISNMDCPDCSKMYFQLSDPVLFIKKEKRFGMYMFKEYQVVAEDYNEACRLLCTNFGHKYHDKSTVVSKIPYLYYKTERIFDKDQTIVQNNGMTYPTSFNRLTFSELLRDGETSDQLYVRMFKALDKYFKPNSIRYYLKSYDGKSKVVQFSLDLRLDPDKLFNVQPMVFRFMNHIYWKDIEFEDQDGRTMIEKGEVLPTLWAAWDMGFRWSQTVDGLSGLYCSRIIDFDIKLIEETFLCPITRRILFNPVVTPSGRSYDKEAIEEYIRMYGMDPFTREALTLDDLTENKTLARLVTQVYIGMDLDKL
jgi:hypothetical protein